MNDSAPDDERRRARRLADELLAGEADGALQIIHESSPEDVRRRARRLAEELLARGPTAGLSVDERSEASTWAWRLLADPAAVFHLAPAASPVQRTPPRREPPLPAGLDEPEWLRSLETQSPLADSMPSQCQYESAQTPGWLRKAALLIQPRRPLGTISINTPALKRIGKGVWPASPDPIVMGGILDSDETVCDPVLVNAPDLPPLRKGLRSASPGVVGLDLGGTLNSDTTVCDAPRLPKGLRPASPRVIELGAIAGSHAALCDAPRLAKGARPASPRVIELGATSGSDVALCDAPRLAKGTRPASPGAIDLGGTSDSDATECDESVATECDDIEGDDDAGTPGVNGGGTPVNSDAARDSGTSDSGTSDVNGGGGGVIEEEAEEQELIMEEEGAIGHGERAVLGPQGSPQDSPPLGRHGEEAVLGAQGSPQDSPPLGRPSVDVARLGSDMFNAPGKPCGLNETGGGPCGGDPHTARRPDSQASRRRPSASEAPLNRLMGQLQLEEAPNTGRGPSCKTSAYTRAAAWLHGRQSLPENDESASSAAGSPLAGLALSLYTIYIICIYMYLYVFIYLSMYVSISIYLYTYIYICTYICIYMLIYIYIYRVNCRRTTNRPPAWLARPSPG